MAETEKYDEFKQEVNALTVRAALKAETPVEKRVLSWLEANASDTLAEKIGEGKKTLKGALKYAKDEAKKMAGSESCICVDDETVFGWIVHFFEEDSIEEPKEKPAVRAPAKAKKPEKKKSTGPAKMSVQGEYKPATEKKEDDSNQLSLFDSMMVTK